MNIDPLVAELASPEYATLTDAQAADAVNAKTAAVRRPVPTWLVRQTAIELGVWPALVSSSTPLTISVLAWIDDASGTIQTVDMGRPSVQAMLAGLVESGILTASQSATINGLADATIPWTESVGLPEVGIGLVINARRLIGG